MGRGKHRAGPGRVLIGVTAGTGAAISLTGARLLAGDGSAVALGVLAQIVAVALAAWTVGLVFERSEARARQAKAAMRLLEARQGSFLESPRSEVFSERHEVCLAESVIDTQVIRRPESLDDTRVLVAGGPS